MEVIPHHLFGKLRIFVVNGVPWFIGRDVATALQYNQPHKAVKRHVSANQKCTYEALHATVAGGTSRTTLTETQPHTIFVNEAGLYSLVLASKLPAEVAFKDWICEDVLPSIRKYGRYSFDQDLRNELQLHNALCGYIRKQFPTLRMSPGLGELQDTDRKRIEESAGDRGTHSYSLHTTYIPTFFAILKFGNSTNTTRRGETQTNSSGYRRPDG